ncbi:MAG: hypothetical protein ACPGJA_03605 [Candidatus Thalassarchaeaceae archaeon]
MGEGEESWWSEDRATDQDESSPTTNTGQEPPSEEIVGRENIDTFLEDIGYYDSEDKERKGETTTELSNSPKPQPPVVSVSKGFLGLWWLTRGEALFVISATVFALIISSVWTVGLINESNYTEVSATVVAEEDDNWVLSEAEVTGDGTNGTGWFMDDLSSWYEDCYTDSDGYEYCDSYWVDEYECYADLYLSWNVSGVEYNGWAFTPSIITPYTCLAYMEQHYRIGDVIPIYYGESDPSQFQAFTITMGDSQSTRWTETMYHWAEGPNLYTEFACEAILTVAYPDPLDSSSQITTRVLDGWNDGAALFGIYSVDPCLAEIMGEYNDGRAIIVMVDDKDATKAYQPGATPEGFFSVTWFCCLGLMFVLVIVSFVVVRLNNTPPGNYVTRNGVVHHGGYDGNDVTIINNHYGNRWGYNHGPGVHYRRPSRRVSSTRTRSSGGGSRSSGGRSTRGRSGGGSSSGGGSRSSGGGRSGGGGRSRGRR